MESGLLPKVSPEEAQNNFRVAIESGVARLTLQQYDSADIVDYRS